MRELTNKFLDDPDWRPVVGAEDKYLVHKDGRIFSLLTNRLRRPAIASHGYYCLNMGKSMTSLVHRIIAMAFIPNPKNLEEVNHIDGNKTNNVIENLEWVTHGENIAHSYRFLGRKRTSLRMTGSLNVRAKRVKAISPSGVITIHETVKDAIRSLGITRDGAWKVLSGRRSSTRGFKLIEIR